MSIIHRYILWELVKASAAAVALFAFILITGNAIREILAFLLDGRMDLWMFLNLIGLLMPYVIAYALPMGVLMGVLTVLGKLCAQGEYTAFKACGVSLQHLSAPIWIFSALCVAGLVGINFYYAPVARSSYFSTLSQTIRSDPLKFLAPKTFVKEFPGYILYARERQGTVLKDFWIWELDSRNRPLKLVRAREGSLKFDAKTDSLTLDLDKGFSELRDTKNPDDLKTIRPTLSFDHANVKLPLNRFLNGEERGGLTTLTLPKLLELQKELEGKMKANPKDRQSLTQLTQLRFQIQQNLAFAFAVLSLALLGVPLGIKASRKETSANLAIALGLALGYYFLIVMTSWASRMPEIRPELLVWLPNVLFMGAGGWLFWRVSKA